MYSLKKRAWLGLVFLALAMGLFLFLPAGTLQYWQAWLYLCVFFGVSVLITLYLMENDPALLKRRLSAGPTAGEREGAKDHHAIGFNRIHRPSCRASA